MVKTTKYEDDTDWRSQKKKKSKMKKMIAKTIQTPPIKIEPVSDDDEDVPLNKLRNEIIKEKTSTHKNVCKICQKRFRELYHLKFHMRAHTQKCLECGKEFKEVAHLKSHQKAHLNKVRCELCNEFYHPNGLKYHVQTVHKNPRNRECIACGTQFFSQQDFRNHMKKHRRQEAPRSTCEVCKKTFSERSKMLVHLRIHTGELPFACELCNEKFHSRSYIKEHMRKAHLVDLYPCAQCDFRAKKLSDLKLHIQKNHTGETPFQCETCLQCFFSTVDLKKHILNEHSKDVHNCETCNKSFKRLDHLKRHLDTVHSLDKPKQYKCDKCATSFGYAKQLRTHIAIHNGSKFACRKCGRAFGTKLNHARHENACKSSVKEEGGAFRCDICPLSFKSSKELEKHNCFEDNNSGSDDDDNEFDDYEPFIDNYTNGIKKSICDVKVILKDINQSDQANSEESKNSKSITENGTIDSLEESSLTHAKLSDSQKYDDTNLTEENYVALKNVTSDKISQDENSKGVKSDRDESEDEEQLYVCEVCKKPFLYLNSLVQHSRVHLMNNRRRVS